MYIIFFSSANNDILFRLHLKDIIQSCQLTLYIWILLNTVRSFLFCKNTFFFEWLLHCTSEYFFIEIFHLTRYHGIDVMVRSEPCAATHERS